MPTYRQQLYNRLIDAGFLPFEAREYAKQYTIGQFRSLPYLRKMVQSRRLYIANLRSRGLITFDEKTIRIRILNLYKRKGWLRPDGKPDAWKPVKAQRQNDIDSGDYIPPKKKGSHHKQPGVSEGDVQAQRQRRKSRQGLEGYARGRGRE